MRNNVNMVKEEIKSIKTTVLNQMGLSSCGSSLTQSEPSFRDGKILFEVEIRERERERERERDRGRRLQVIPSRLRPVSEGYNPRSSFSLPSTPRRGSAAARLSSCCNCLFSVTSPVLLPPLVCFV
ncbi:hypothetical protein M9H77_06729 [Catharanthus roseus]|uniref:Uncharacterized protein n=1 Tax=Catharanthus roseus TaxID=4058 RepID=A0ACC0BT58_CATRO|nr:hypothetical protein M9H77_06729 [Catharanthus roseus]